MLLRASLVLLTSHRAQLLAAETPEQCLAVLSTAVRTNFDSDALVNGMNERRFSWDQLQEWRRMMGVGASELHLPVLVIADVIEQGRCHYST